MRWAIATELKAIRHNKFADLGWAAGRQGHRTEQTRTLLGTRISLFICEYDGPFHGYPPIRQVRYTTPIFGWLLGVLWGTFYRHSELQAHDPISHTIEAKSKTSLERLPPPSTHVCSGCIFWIDKSIRGPLGSPPVEHFPCGGFAVR